MSDTPKASSTANFTIPASAAPCASPILPPVQSALVPPSAVELAKIEVQPAASDRSTASFNAFFTGLREMVEACRSTLSKAEVVANVIVACLLEGIHEGYRITGIVDKLGFNRQHAGMTLRHMTDGGRTSLLWKQGGDGLYYLID
ncbi:hypothetical protein EQZ23_18030 [Sphingomonas sp. UV9]|uniref:hypothetical protein n=1 Tax=Sphingomonas sp. UV9 TaxID=1851410 RepID=UPI000FFB5B4B|nr:hypothetical protein [Sphingomonas sp. UV9]RXD02520.1 hypothetical protein EQZ23_18030 [Sphingomonas sp. UV9]